VGRCEGREEAGEGRREVCRKGMKEMSVRDERDMKRTEAVTGKMKSRGRRSVEN
jgi:hypothetical protein